jgi:hypothetical protein
VAGAGGAGTYELRDPEYPRSVAGFEAHGFAVLEADDQTLTVRLVGSEGMELHVTTIRK